MGFRKDGKVNVSEASENEKSALLPPRASVLSFKFGKAPRGVGWKDFLPSPADGVTKALI